jgi:predicted AlkP superfamily pyrophosphatase or phosphodiesterase
MRRTLVLDVVGLTPKLIGPHTPNLAALARQGALRPLRTIEPAVTCSVQSTFTTGLLPRDHGCVANGWYFRDIAEVALWRQSNALVSGEKIWDAGKRRDPAFTCAKLFWWFNMYATADFAVTPRPQYPADGRKVPDIHTHPGALRAALQDELGTFPLFRFWGPAADITCSAWIARAASRIFDVQRPTLTLVYLPHLDYNLQRLGPNHPEIANDLRAIDAVCGPLIEQAQKADARVVVLSEYGITEVRGAVAINQALRRAGLLEVRSEQAGEILDAGASEAFAVVDHQFAHVYVRRRERVAEVAELLRATEGIDEVWDAEAKRAHGLDHPRAGELVAVAARDRWFSYYYWLDEERAPDFARTVDIHRKPGYDPCELFLDPALRFPKLRVARRLLQKKLGMRYLMDVVPRDAALVRGSHGRLPDDPLDGPVFLSSRSLPESGGAVQGGVVAMTSVRDRILSLLTRP